MKVRYGMKRGSPEDCLEGLQRARKPMTNLCFIALGKVTGDTW